MALLAGGRVGPASAARFDLHVHSGRSRDGKGTIAELAHAAAAAGLSGFSITDHDAVWREGEVEAAAAEAGVIIIPGCEVTALEGHLLAFGVTSALPRRAPVRDTVGAVTDQGGVAAPSHPLRMFSGVGPSLLATLAHEHIVRIAEVRNGRDRRLVQKNTARHVAVAGLAGIGGTDAHWVSDIGATWTEFPETPTTAAHAVRLLAQGWCRAGGGNLPRRKVAGHALSLPGRAWQRRVGGDRR
jgi:predicted metal-dependent phosphoesterase TrpH